MTRLDRSLAIEDNVHYVGEVLRQVKRLHPHVKVIVLTGYARRQSISDFLLYGADDYLSKPFQVPELLATVQRITAGPPTAGAASV